MKVKNANGKKVKVPFIVKGVCKNNGQYTCNLGFACDGCPYNKEEIKMKKSNKNKNTNKNNNKEGGKKAMKLKNISFKNNLKTLNDFLNKIVNKTKEIAEKVISSITKEFKFYGVKIKDFVIVIFNKLFGTPGARLVTLFITSILTLFYILNAELFIVTMLLLGWYSVFMVILYLLVKFIEDLHFKNILPDVTDSDDYKPNFDDVTPDIL